ncbi:unnamed protein product [Pocillopora meandrina]|uniref:Uncharacterized protein n=1 Tax=Pocillopora meandrina TaxID=46732 RepID=A0AAU9X179_9CNID|nr:unnamed protein product [Pocillopora meandrina]
MRWTSVIQPPEGVNFREEVGMRVEMDNDNNCLDYFQPLFTDDVYQLILRETKRFEHQKRQLEDNSLGGREKGEVTRAMAKAEHRTATVD